MGSGETLPVPGPSLGFASLKPSLAQQPAGIVAVLTFKDIGVGCSGLDWIGGIKNIELDSK